MEEKHAAKKPEPNTKPATEPPKKLGFLDLPPEIRNQIYGYAIPRKQRLTIYAAPPGIMQTCRKVRSETRTMFYSNNTFIICTRHRQHKLAAEQWFAVVHPTVSTLLEQMLIKSCNLEMTLNRIAGTDKWAAYLDPRSISAGKKTPLTQGEMFSAVNAVYGVQFQHQSRFSEPYPHDIKEIQGLIKNTRRYDEYADREKLDRFVRPLPSAMLPRRRTAGDYALMIATVPLLPIVLGVVGVVCLKDAAKKLHWNLNEPKKDVCNPAQE
ncbi:hypothetical protein MBLNU457_2175t1 [Dothideomycetes sp. NU457]